MTLFGSWNDLPAITQLKDESSLRGEPPLGPTTYASFPTDQDQRSFCLSSSFSFSDLLASPLKASSLPHEPVPVPAPHPRLPQAAKDAIEKMKCARLYVGSLVPCQFPGAAASVMEAMRSCAAPQQLPRTLQGSLSEPVLVPSVLSHSPQAIPPTAKRSLGPAPAPPSKRQRVDMTSTSPTLESSRDPCPRLVVPCSAAMSHVGNRLGRHLHRHMALQAAMGLEPDKIGLSVSEHGGFGVDLGIAGVLQCAGMNRKKRTRCRNAALMEYVGPRPIYCAEHISLDPEALYHKCGLAIDCDKGAKFCKEVVLHNFKYCYKHIGHWLASSAHSPGALEETRSLLATASALSGARLAEQ